MCGKMTDYIKPADGGVSMGGGVHLHFVILYKEAFDMSVA